MATKKKTAPKAPKKPAATPATTTPTVRLVRRIVPGTGGLVRLFPETTP